MWWEIDEPKRTKSLEIKVDGLVQIRNTETNMVHHFDDKEVEGEEFFLSEV